MSDSKAPTTQDAPLKLAGYGYLLGDAALFASGMASGHHKEAATGLIWTTGALTLARYGKPDQEHQLQEFNQQLREHFERENVAIPLGSNLSSAELSKHGGVVHTIENFLHKYPSQTLNAIYALGSVQLIRSGVQHGKHWDVASGALVAGGALAGLLIPQQKPDPDHPPQGTMAKAWSWIQEKPLRLSSGLYMANNVTLAMSAMRERQQNPAQKSYMFKFLTVASYVVANGLLAMSSKEDQTLAADPVLQQKLEDTAAAVIAAQPPQVQQAILKNTSAYLAQQLKLPTSHIEQQLTARVALAAPALPAPGWESRMQMASLTPTQITP
jgi:hypothetical protein